MGSFGFEEMFLVAVVAIMVFGKDLPSMARKAGRWYRDIKIKLEDLKSEVKRQMPEVDLDVDLENDATGRTAPSPDLSKPFNPISHDAPKPPGATGGAS